MVTIYNTELFKELKDGVKLQQLTDVIPSQLADKVVPVMEVNPKLLRYDKVLASYTNVATSGAATILAADSTRETYITGISVTMLKDVACDVTSAARNITVTIDGVSVNLISMALISLTAQQMYFTITFQNPIKIDRGTSIAASSFSFTAGVAARAYVIYGFTQDNPRA